MFIQKYEEMLLRIANHIFWLPMLSFFVTGNFNTNDPSPFFATVYCRSCWGGLSRKRKQDILFNSFSSTNRLVRVFLLGLMKYQASDEP